MNRKFNIEGRTVEVSDEATMRQGLLNEATKLGCVSDIRMLFDKYDKLLRNCTNPQEREHISRIGVEEVNKVFAWYQQLYENGQPVLIKA